MPVCIQWEQHASDDWGSDCNQQQTTDLMTFEGQHAMVTQHLGQLQQAGQCMWQKKQSMVGWLGGGGGGGECEQQ
jgi:hypothetical protein